MKARSQVDTARCWEKAIHSSLPFLDFRHKRNRKTITTKKITITAIIKTVVRLMGTLVLGVGVGEEGAELLVT